MTSSIYMGVARIGALQTGLLGALPVDTPAAVVQHATLPQQRHAVCTLGALAQTVEREGLGSPAIVVIGDVARGLLHARSQNVQAAQPMKRTRSA